MASMRLVTPSAEQLRSDMMLASRVARSASTAAAQQPGVRLVYSTTPTWPFSSPCSSPSSCASSQIDIAVLDSSFNPPSRAHLALLLSEPILTQGKRAYDGHLLLFSTQNADKGAGKPGDASLLQRVEMMTLVAKDVERIQASSGHPANVAVGLVDKPLIFAKSTLTWTLLQQQQQQQQREQREQEQEKAAPRLHWVVGFDTLYRVFQLKYYASLDDFERQCAQFFERERTTFVCARRHPSSYPELISSCSPDEGRDAAESARNEENKLLQSDRVAPWVERGSIGMLDIDPDQAKLSSTKIRALLRDAETDAARNKEKLKQLVPPSLAEYLVEARVYQDQVHGE